MHDERAFIIVFEQACVHELLHHVGGKLPSFGIFLKLHYLLLESEDLFIFGSILQFLLQLLLLIGLDLLLSPSALACGLEHVCGDAFGDYNHEHPSQNEIRSIDKQELACP